jgi:hypothetical protein
MDTAINQSVLIDSEYAMQLTQAINQLIVLRESRTEYVAKLEQHILKALRERIIGSSMKAYQKDRERVKLKISPIEQMVLNRVLPRQDLFLELLLIIGKNV